MVGVHIFYSISIQLNPIQSAQFIYQSNLSKIALYLLFASQWILKWLFIHLYNVHQANSIRPYIYTFSIWFIHL